MRIHHWTREPWYFQDNGSYRFDLQWPEGTCYCAEEAEGAIIEVFQDWIPTAIPKSELNARRLSSLRTDRDLILADCTKAECAGFGVTAEIHTIADRFATQEWARKFREQGFDGIKYLVRHDPSMSLTGFAVFGKGGVASLPIKWTRAISDSIIDTTCDRFGLKVI